MHKIIQRLFLCPTARVERLISTASRVPAGCFKTVVGPYLPGTQLQNDSHGFNHLVLQIHLFPSLKYPCPVIEPCEVKGATETSDSELVEWKVLLRAKKMKRDQRVVGASSLSATHMIVAVV